MSKDVERLVDWVDTSLVKNALLWRHIWIANKVFKLLAAIFKAFTVTIFKPFDEAMTTLQNFSKNYVMISKVRLLKELLTLFQYSSLFLEP